MSAKGVRVLETDGDIEHVHWKSKKMGTHPISHKRWRPTSAKGVLETDGDIEHANGLLTSPDAHQRVKVFEDRADCASCAIQIKSKCTDDGG